MAIQTVTDAIRYVGVDDNTLYSAHGRDGHEDDGM